MTSDIARKATAIGSQSSLWIAVGVAVALVFFVVSGAISYSNIQTLRADSDQIVHSHDVITTLDALLSSTQDAETGQRGFVLTGAERYLQPYDDALPKI